MSAPMVATLSWPQASAIHQQCLHFFITSLGCAGNSVIPEGFADHLKARTCITTFRVRSVWQLDSHWGLKTSIQYIQESMTSLDALRLSHPSESPKSTPLFEFRQMIRTLIPIYSPFSTASLLPSSSNCQDYKQGFLFFSPSLFFSLIDKDHLKIEFSD